MQTRQAKLPSHERVDQLLRDDFISSDLTALDVGEDLFSDLVGCDDVVRKLKEYERTVAYCKSVGTDPKDAVEWNFVFTGSPGTGKTTVGRRCGWLCYCLFLLSQSATTSSFLIPFLRYL